MNVDGNKKVRKVAISPNPHDIPLEWHASLLVCGVVCGM